MWGNIPVIRVTLFVILLGIRRSTTRYSPSHVYQKHYLSHILYMTLYTYLCIKQLLLYFCYKLYKCNFSLYSIYLHMY